MYRIYYFSAFIFLFFISSCKRAESPVYETEFLFKVPQPENDGEISSFSNRFIGNYISDDSTYLIVNKTNILHKSIYKSYLNYSKFESLRDSLRIVDNKIFFEGEKYITFRKLKDSIEISDIRYDYFFDFR